MKNVITFLFTFALFFSSAPLLHSQCGNLYISGTIDGPLTGGLPKGVRVCANADIADLSIYGLGSANNGGGSDGQEFTFPARKVYSGDCIWVASESTQFAAFFGFAPLYTSGAMGINGDDAVELFCSGSVTDLFGDINTDGTGECWDHLDGWAANSNTAPNGGTFDCADYTFSGTNALDGESTNATADTPFPTPAQILPVTFLSFSGTLKGDMIQLSWSTLSEINNEKFEIQRTKDGKYFETIGEVKGNGDSSSKLDYTFTDERPYNGINYYRLKQIDFDGAYEYSTLIAVEKTDFTLRVYPTTTNDFIMISMTENKSFQGNIVSKVGQVVKSFNGDEKESRIDISDIPTGQYYIRISTENLVYTEKIIKI